MTRDILIHEMQREKVVAIARGVTAEQAVEAARALYAGGIRFMEVTFDAAGETSDEQTGYKIAAVAAALRGKMRVGAGTVLTAEQVEITKRSGGAFVISPTVDGDVIRRTTALDMVSIPGAMTPTEALCAHNCGADFVKIFPAGDLGPAYIRAIRGPLGHIRLMAVGGVSDSNIAQFLAAGCVGAGIGGSLVSKKAIEAGDYAALTAAAERTVAAARA